MMSFADTPAGNATDEDKSGIVFVSLDLQVSTNKKVVAPFCARLAPVLRVRF